MRLIKLAYRNIVDKPLNLLLSIILFALGVGLINFLLLFNQQLKEKFESNLAGIDLVLGAKGSPLQLILCNMYHIDNPTGNVKIADAKPFLNPKHPIIELAVPLSLGDNYKNFRIVGTNNGIIQLYKASLREGVMWQKPMEVTIGWQVADQGGLKLGDSFVSSHGFAVDDDLEHEHSKLKVVGILQPTGSVIDQLILTHTATIWEVHEHQHEEEPQDKLQNMEGDTMQNSEMFGDGSNLDLLNFGERSITSILVKYKSRTSIQALNMPRNINENTNLQAVSPAYEINKLVDLIGVGTNGIKAIAYLIALVSALSIFISLFRAMKERKYELALMRVMGGSRATIFLLILMEGIMLALFGWLIGIILSHAGMELMAKYLRADFRYSFTGKMWLTEEWVLLLASLAIGLLSAAIPAWSAARRDVNEVLEK